MVKHFVTVILIISFSTLSLIAQRSRGGIPPGLRQTDRLLKSKTSVIIDLPSIDNAKLIQEDDNDSLNVLKPLRFAVKHTVDYSIYNSGEWLTDADGNPFWRIVLRSQNAFSLMLIFSNYSIPEGAELFVYDESKEFILGAYTSDNNNNASLLSVTPVPGEVVTIEYLVPKDIEDRGQLTIGSISHDYRNAFGYSTLKDGNYNRSGSCEIDINCDLGDNWQTEKRSICRLVIPKKDASYLCTGSLINNTAENGTPYVFSANHCINDQYAADRTLFLFNYESPYCDGPDGYSYQTLSGSLIKATTTKLDFVLVQLNDTPPFAFNPYYAGWNIQTTGLENVNTLHHPAGDVKKISYSSKAPVQSNFSGTYFDANSHWKILRWDDGVTEGGSSGAPLFDQNKRIIGDLSGGYSSCSCVLSCSDYFQMFSRSWSDYSTASQQLKYWLDPLNLGKTAINGFDPYLAYKSTCDTLSNKTIIESAELHLYPNGGYWSGTNVDGITKYAERYDFADSTKLTGVFINVAKNSYLSYEQFLVQNPQPTDYSYLQKYTAWNNYLSENSYIKIKVYADSNGVPGNQIIATKVIANKLKEGLDSYVPFNTITHVKGVVYVGFDIFYSANDTFALYSSPKRIPASTGNTGFAYVSNLWQSSSEWTGEMFGLSYDIRPIVCDSLPEDAFPHVRKKIIKSDVWQVFPNPSSGTFTLTSNEPLKYKTNIRIYSMTGQIQYQQTLHEGISEIPIHIQQTGLYIIRIDSNNSYETLRIIIQ